MNYLEALTKAQEIKGLLVPHCFKIEIAGSIRRKKPNNIKDIEIVCIPKPYSTGIFIDGFAKIVNKWEKKKGDLKGVGRSKYTQRLWTDGTKIDIFITTQKSFGKILAIRTGSADFSHKILAKRWRELGYVGRDGILCDLVTGESVEDFPTEESFFSFLNIDYIEPEFRNVDTKGRVINFITPTVLKLNE